MAKIYNDRTGQKERVQMAFNYQKHGEDLTLRKALGDADKLFNSMGNKEYQSSLKVDISVSLRKSPAAQASNTIVPDVDIEPTLRYVPSKSIGAEKGDDGRKEFNNTTVNSFIVPVSTQRVALLQSDKIQEWFIDQIHSVFPEINVGGKTIDWDKYATYRQSVTSHNQAVAKQIDGLLNQRNVTGQVRRRLRASLMQKGRKIFSTYSVDITVNIVHNIFNSYFEKNYKDSIENVDYYESKSKLYSRNVTKRISIPVCSMEELRRVFQVVKEFNPNLNELEVIDGKKIIELSQEPSNKSFIESDELLAEELGLNNSEVVEDNTFPSIDLMMNMFRNVGTYEEQSDEDSPDILL